MTLELSNEIWNGGFPAHRWMKLEAQRKGITFEAQIASQIELVLGVADTVFSGPEGPTADTHLHSCRRAWLTRWTGEPPMLTFTGPLGGAWSAQGFPSSRTAGKAPPSSSAGVSAR